MKSHVQVMPGPPITFGISFRRLYANSIQTESTGVIVFNTENPPSKSHVWMPLRSTPLYGDIAQRESICLASRTSAVQSRLSPPNAFERSDLPSVSSGSQRSDRKHGVIVFCEPNPRALHMFEHLPVPHLYGDIAQRESACLARRMSGVQSSLSPPIGALWFSYRRAPSKSARPNDVRYRITGGWRRFDSFRLFHSLSVERLPQQGIDEL